MLKSIDKDYGCEIDIRSNGDKLILNHDPFQSGVNLNEFLDHYSHGTLILNIKETGIEDIVIREVEKRKIKSYFLLDVEYPFLIKNLNNNKKNIAVRFSEFESIENVIQFKNKYNWVWIDTVSKLPIKKSNFDILNSFKICVVCPSLWNRTNQINNLKKMLLKYNFKNLHIMTDVKQLNSWIS